MWLFFHWRLQTNTTTNNVISEYKSIRLFEKYIFPFFLKHLLIPISYNRADFTSFQYPYLQYIITFQYPYLQYIITSKTIVIVKPNQDDYNNDNVHSFPATSNTIIPSSLTPSCTYILLIILIRFIIIIIILLQ